MGIRITPGQVTSEVRAINKGARLAARRAMIRAAHRGRVVLVGKTPVDQGQLKASWKVRVSKGTGIGGDRLAAVISNDAPHAGIVERGARPHPVSREGWMAIYNWVWRNRAKFSGVGSQSSAEGRRLGDLDPVAARITWGIVGRLKREGQKPTFFVRDALPTLQKIAADETAKAVARLARQKAQRRAKARERRKREEGEG